MPPQVPQPCFALRVGDVPELEGPGAGAGTGDSDVCSHLLLAGLRTQMFL